MGDVFTNCRTYSVDVSHKYLNFIWNNSNDVDNFIDVSSIGLANRVWDEEVYEMELATTINLEIYKSLVLSNTGALHLVSHDLRFRRQIKERKERNELSMYPVGNQSWR